MLNDLDLDVLQTHAFHFLPNYSDHLALLQGGLEDFANRRQWECFEDIDPLWNRRGKPIVRKLHSRVHAVNNGEYG
ncbi:hypothetical protein D3C73_1512180 [compost metagenome]|jgi:hypothetical protein